MTRAHDTRETHRIPVDMAHHPKRRLSTDERPRHQRITAIVVALMVLALMAYGYQFWWSE
jgi:hypothetical protein